MTLRTLLHCSRCKPILFDKMLRCIIRIEGTLARDLVRLQELRGSELDDREPADDFADDSFVGAAQHPPGDKSGEA